MTRTAHLVTVDELADRLDTVRLLDVRWALRDAPGDGRRRYAEGHLPGARFLDLEEVLTSHTDDPLDGRHPLPDATTLAEGLGALGLELDDVVGGGPVTDIVVTGPCGPTGGTGGRRPPGRGPRDTYG